MGVTRPEVSYAASASAVRGCCPASVVGAIAPLPAVQLRNRVGAGAGAQPQLQCCEWRRNRVVSSD
jgi:hypothetical protein